MNNENEEHNVMNNQEIKEYINNLEPNKMVIIDLTCRETSEHE